MEWLPERRLDEAVRMHNPWWVSGTVPPATRHTLPRALDNKLLAAERNAVVQGPRGSGKTSALMRLVDTELRRGRHPRRIGYLPFDHPLLRLSPAEVVVRRILDLMDPGGDRLLLLDGAQALPDGLSRLAAQLEDEPGVRFVAGTSVSAEPGDRGYDVHTLAPLRFREFCDARGLPHLGAPPLDPREPKLPPGNDQEDYFFHRVLDPMLADYLVRGGFPEAVAEADAAAARNGIREKVVARALHQDLPGIAGVMKRSELERVLMGALLQDSPLQLEAFSDALELDRHTAVRYLDHLGRLMLLVTLKNHAAATDRSRPRIHSNDPSIRNSLFEQGAAILADRRARRALLVDAVVAHVADSALARGLDLAYFREGEAEADVVVVTPEGPIPIVVVDREEITDTEAGLVERLLRRLQADTAFVLSRAQPRRKTAVSFFESVVHLPVAYFLYALQE